MAWMDMSLNSGYFLFFVGGWQSETGGWSDVSEVGLLMWFWLIHLFINLSWVYGSMVRVLRWARVVRRGS
jgi:hypothetical protein